MWLTEIELHNIKSYSQRTTISLAQGVNAICGKNGAGKSTILEAIGFTLFGKAAYSQEQFIHEKAKKGEIIITLFDSRDQRQYQIVRPVKSGTPYVYDREIKRQLATGVDDVQRWLRDCMKVDPTTDLKVLFENAIGVAQGLLTVSFLETEAKRRAVFDPLLNVADYKQAWEKLLEVTKQVKEWHNDNKTEQANLKGQLIVLPTYQGEAQELQQKIEKVEGEWSVLIMRLDELDKALDRLDQQKGLIEQLTQQLDRLSEQGQVLQDKLQTARNDLEQARQSRTTVVECQADYQAYEQAQQGWIKIERDRPIRDEIRRRQAELDKQLALLQQHSDRLRSQLNDVAKAEARLVELAPKVEKQTALEQACQQAQKAVDDLKTVEQRLVEEEKRWQTLQQEFETARTQLQQRQQLTQTITQLEQQRRQQFDEMTKLDSEIADLEQQLANLGQALQTAQTQLTHYENVQARLRETQAVLDQKQEKLRRVKSELEQRRQLEAQLETLTARRTHRQSELSALDGQTGDLTAAERQAQQNFSQWQLKVQALNTHQQNLEATKAKLALAQTELTSLEQGLVQRQDTQAQIATLEIEQAETNHQRDAHKDRLSRYAAKLVEINEALNSLQLEADSPCPVCQKPLSEHEIQSLQAHYQAEIKVLTTQQTAAQATLKETESRLKHIQRQTKKLQTDLETLPTQTQVTTQKQRMADYEQEAAGEEAHIAALTDAPNQVAHFEQEIEQLQNSLASLKQQQEGLRQADQSDETEQQRLQTEINQLARPAEVDPLETDLKQLDTDLEQWQTEVKRLSDVPQQVAELQVAHQTIGQQKAERQQHHREIGQAREALVLEIQQHQAKVEVLAGSSQLEQLQTELESQAVVLANWRDQAESLAAAPEQLRLAEAALHEWGDPHRDYQAAEIEATKRADIEADLGQTQAQEQAGQQSRIGIEQELLPYSNLEVETQEVSATLNRTRAAHQRYLEHKSTAETLPLCEARVTDLQQALSKLTGQQTALEQKLTEVRAGYDADDHLAKQTDREQDRTRRIELETEAKTYRDQLTQLHHRIEALAQVEAELAALQQKGEQLARLHQVVEFIRSTLKDAGPEMTRRLVKAISLRADQIYGDIMNDHQQELIWDQTYGISVRRDGYLREFQQLSGGEAMAAALAVRLALLQSMSAVDVAFFDEPTANLDPERRANLAEQIARIKGFSQLVVISHDDTFEQDIGHVIHIAKDEQGCSRVVV